MQTSPAIRDDRRQKLLRTAFLVGAITDALAVVPMLLPSMASLVWGFDDPTGAYRFAMGYGAALMAGWTGLLLWAYRCPSERAFVAALTVFVIYGLIATEVVAVLAGDMTVWRMIPTWILQAALLALFAGAYHFPFSRRSVAAMVVAAALCTPAQAVEPDPAAFTNDLRGARPAQHGDARHRADDGGLDPTSLRTEWKLPLFEPAP